MDALADMFKFERDVPSTPARGLTREVSERTIWGYWAQGHDQMPELFKLCVGTWRLHNPHWDVRILERSTVKEYLSDMELPNRFMHMLSHQAASDAVRLALMSRYGGVWMDVNIILCADLDRFCWNAIESRQKSAAVFFHPHYGTKALGGEDLTESWFLAARPGSSFFMCWRDLFRELMHNRLDVKGLLQHPLYQDIDLSGIDRLNHEFGADFDFREYLAIHAMCHRLLEKNPQAYAQWRDTFQRNDAAQTAFRVQLQAERLGMAAAQLLVSLDPRVDKFVEGVPLIKLRTPDYGPLLALSREQLLHPGHLLGRLLTGKATGGAAGAAVGGVGAAGARMGTSRGICSATRGHIISASIARNAGRAGVTQGVLSVCLLSAHAWACGPTT